MLFFTGLLTLGETTNAISTLADLRAMGMDQAAWEPFVWEYSSGVALMLVLPLLHRLVERYPLLGKEWWRRVPVHLLATLPFSLAHVSLMVAMRKVVYLAAEQHYSFGPWWTNWRYEYTKDFFTYWLFCALLMAFYLYSLWREAPSSNSEAPTRLVGRKFNREFILNLDEIDRISASGNYVTLYKEGTSYSLRESLTSLENKLNPQHFARVHRSHIVNINHIREIQPWGHGDYRILMQDGGFVNFSRRYRQGLERLFI